MADPTHAAHYDSAERQTLSAGFGMWLFLASEVLFFGALFTLYAGMRSAYPTAFARAVADNTLYLGSINTVVLLTSSFLIVLAVHRLGRDQRRSAALFAFATALLGLAFLGIKAYEYTEHFAHGIRPGGVGQWFAAHGIAGAAEFWTMYYVMTGLHAIHVAVGVVVLTVLGILVLRGRISSASPQALDNGALYWHLVDIIWLFLWPLFYLVRR